MTQLLTELFFLVGVSCIATMAFVMLYQRRKFSDQIAAILGVILVCLQIVKIMEMFC